MESPLEIRAVRTDRDRVGSDSSAEGLSDLVGDMATVRSPRRAGRSPRRSGWRQVLPLPQIIQKIEGQATACVEWLTSVLQVGPGNRSGQAPSVGTDRGNEAPGAPWRVKSTQPQLGQRIRILTGKSICFPQTPHLGQAKVPDQSF